MDGSYSRSFEVPTPEDYCRLRRVAGLTPRSLAAARAGLPNTVAAVVVRRAGEAVGMGRVIGDGLNYVVVDIAVAPEHQGRGLGKAIVAGLMERIRAIAPAEVHLSLLADGEAHRLYAQYGFFMAAPASHGMEMWIGTPDGSGA